MTDAHKNFAYSTVATAPSPATSGTSLVVATGTGTNFPAAPFNAVVCPAGAQPTLANAEIVRVTNIATDTFTITRAQEGSSARTIVVGDQIFCAITAKTLTDVEPGAVGVPLVVARQSDTAARNSGNTGSTLTADDTLLFAVSGNSTDVWHFEAFLLFQAANATMDVKIGWTVPTGTTMKWGMGFVAGSAGFVGSPASATSYTVSSVLTQGSSAAYATGITDNFVRAEGYVLVGGTSGSVVLTWAQNTSDAGNLVLLKGSHLRLTRVI